MVAASDARSAIRCSASRRSALADAVSDSAVSMRFSSSLRFSKPSWSRFANVDSSSRSSRTVFCPFLSASCACASRFRAWLSSPCSFSSESLCRASWISMRARVACSNSSRDSSSLVRSSSRLNAMLLDGSPIVSTLSSRVASSTTCSFSDFFSPSSSDTRSSYSAISDCSLDSCFTVALYFFISSAISSSFSSIWACSSARSRCATVARSSASLRARCVSSNRSCASCSSPSSTWRAFSAATRADSASSSWLRSCRTSALLAESPFARSSWLWASRSSARYFRASRFNRCTIASSAARSARLASLRSSSCLSRSSCVRSSCSCSSWHSSDLIFLYDAPRISSISSSRCCASLRASFRLVSSDISSRSLACSSSCIWPAISSSSSSCSLHRRSSSFFCRFSCAISSSVPPPNAISSSSCCSAVTFSSFSSSSSRMSDTVCSSLHFSAISTSFSRAIRSFACRSCRALSCNVWHSASNLRCRFSSRLFRLFCSSYSMRRSFISFVIFCALRFHCATTWRCSSTSSYASASFFSSCFFSPTSCSRSCSCCVCSRFLVNSSSRATRSYRSRSAPSAGPPPRGRSAPSPVLSYSPSVLQSSKSQFSSDLAHSSSISIFSDDSCRWRYFDSYSFTSFSSRNRSDVSAASRSVIRFDDECSSVSSENEERELDRETTLERRAGDDDCSRSSCSPRAIMFDTLRDRTVPPSPLTSPIVPRTPVRPRLRQSCITWSVRRRKSCILLLRYCEAERASERLVPNRGNVAPAGRSTAISCGIVANDSKNCSNMAPDRSSSKGPQDRARSVMEPASVPSAAAFGFFLMIFFITLRTFTTGRLDDDADADGDDGTVAVDVSTLVVTSPSPTSLTSIVAVDLLLVESPFADRLLEEADRSGVFSRRTASPSMRRSEGDFSFGIPSSTVPRTGEALAALIGVELFSVRSGVTDRLVPLTVAGGSGGVPFTRSPFDFRWLAGGGAFLLADAIVVLPPPIPLGRYCLHDDSFPPTGGGLVATGGGFTSGASPTVDNGDGEAAAGRRHWQGLLVSDAADRSFRSVPTLPPSPLLGGKFGTMRAIAPPRMASI
uniref:Uncharacterized protein n=1 Tax=Anopheles melas TaxID=34690 RepID=A0A182TM89_9DIPT